MARIEKQTKRYPSDLTDGEWAAMAPLMPGPAATGRKRTADLREILNAIRYMVRSGCEWRMLPIHFPPWQTVYWWFRRFVRLFLFRTIHDLVLMIDRERAGRAEQPTAAIIDSQSIKAPAAGGTRGYDGAKKIVGRKRHIAVDTDGRLLMVNVTTADIADSTGAQLVIAAVRKRWPWIKHLFADGAYDRRQLLESAALLDFVVEIDTTHRQGFQNPPQTLGRRAKLWMAHQISTLGQRLRVQTRRLRSDDPRRHGKSARQTAYPSLVLKRTLRAPSVLLLVP